MSKSATKVTPASAPVAAPAASQQKGVLRAAYNRQHAFPGTAVITAINVANPKKAGSKSFVRFAAYKVGQTVDQYVAAVVALGQPGCTSLNARADVRWDFVHGFIAVE